MFSNKSTAVDHSEGVSSIGTNTNCTWRWSVWDSIEGTAVYGINGGTRQRQIYGNIISRHNTGPLFYYFETGSNRHPMNNSEMYNNTIVNGAGTSQGSFNVQQGSGNTAYNNLWYDNDANAFSFQNVSHNWTWAGNNVRTEGGNFDKDPEILSGEANGQNGSASPFVSFTTGNPLVDNLALSAATLAGTNTNATIAANGTDMLGNSRGGDGSWDRGAIEFGSGSPTTFYVKPTATGSGSGADWTNAMGSTFTPVRGNTYYLADGAYGAKTFNTAVSGTTLITLKKATVADHGTNTGWTDALGDGQATFSGIVFSTGFWTLDGQTRTSDSTGHGFSTTGGTEIVTFGAFGSPISNITIRYMALIGDGYPSTGNDRAFYCNSPGTSNLTIQYCYVFAPYVTFLTRQVNTMLVEYSFFDQNNSRPAFHAEPWSDSGSDNVTFRYNRIKNPEGTAVFAFLNGGAAGTPQSAANTSTNWQIYGNVIYYLGYSTASGNNAGTSGIVFCAWDANNTNWVSGLVIYNNTFYDFSHGTESGRIFVQNAGTGTQTLVRNNIFDSCGDGVTFTNANTDYNFYRNTTHSAEANQQVGTVNLFASVAAENFRLTAGTVSGLTLAAPFNQDMDGITRTPGSWDRGAFEFSGAAGDTTPPTLSSSVIAASGTTMTRTFSEPVITGTGDNAGWSISLSGGAITGTYASGSGTTAIVYNLSRTVGAAETGTNSYTQPGDGVEDVSLNDLATLAGAVILNNSTVQQVAAPTMSPVAGPYFGTQNVTLTSSTPGSTIRYTVDGSDPTASSTLYASPISVPVSTTIKAKAFASGFTESNISTAAYEIGTWAGTAAWKTFPVSQQTGSFTWTFRASATPTGSDAVIGLSSVPTTAFSLLAAAMRFNTSNTIDARNGGAYAAVNSFTYTAGTTYEFVCTINVTARTYSATVAQIGGTPVTIASNYAFRSEQSTATELDNVGINVPASGTVTVSQMSFGGVTSIPTLTGATIGSNGTTLTLGFSVPVVYGTGGSGGWTISASGGAATLTPTANPTTFTVSRSIATGETGTISYTQPGNGVEAVTGGGDLATLTSFAFNNQSTVDLTPPIPNPMTFSSIPIAPSSFSVTMTASVANDVSTPPVQYYFDETSGNAGGTDSGWTTSRTYTNNGLSPGIQYTYRVLARDSAAVPNQTTPSSSVNVTTPIIAGGKVITPAGTTGAGFFNP